MHHHPQRAAHRERWSALLVHAAVVAFVLALWQWNEEPSTTLTFGGAAVLVAYLGLGWQEGLRSQVWFSPISILFFWSVLNLGLAAIHVGFFISDGSELRFSTLLISPEDMASGYALYMVGTFFLHLGLESCRPLCDPAFRIDSMGVRRTGLKSLMLCIFMGGLFCYNPGWAAPFGVLGAWLSWLAVATGCVLALTPRKALNFSPAGHRTLLALTTIGLIIVQASSGSKAYIMFSFLPLFWRCILYPASRLSIPPLAVLLTLAYVFVVEPCVSAARLRTLHPSNSSSFAANLGTVAFQLETYAARSGDSTDGWDRLAFRAFEPTPVGFLVADVRKRGIRNGETMEILTYAFIPRVLYPGKPSVSRGTWFTYHLGFSDSEEESTTSTAITAIGEFYWNFGIPGVVAGMFTLGCMMGGLWRLTGAIPIRSVPRMCLYVPLMVYPPSLPDATSAIVCLVANFLFYSVVFTVERKFMPEVADSGMTSARV